MCVYGCVHTDGYTETERQTWILPGLYRVIGTLYILKMDINISILLYEAWIDKIWLD